MMMAGDRTYVLGSYARPISDAEWKQWQTAGINLVYCSDREQLDEAAEYGMKGWIRVPMVVRDDEDEAKLRDIVLEMRDHPSLVVWEAPDEAIWNTWRRPTGGVEKLWEFPPDEIAAREAKMDATVAGLLRGAAIVRELDPTRRLWLNEATHSDLDAIGRCAAALDIVGYDHYPIHKRDVNPMHLLGYGIDRFQSAAPGREVWMVEQAFSWSSLSRDDVPDEPAYPSMDEYRFMAWQAYVHNATGILWWGASYEERPAKFMDDLMSVVAELNSVSDLLTVGLSPQVFASPEPRQSHEFMVGCKAVARRLGSKTLLVLVNEDIHSVDAVVNGLDWVNPSDLKPLNKPSCDLVQYRGGLVTTLEPYEARAYIAG
jgi:hypothetical protein